GGALERLHGSMGRDNPRRLRGDPMAELRATRRGGRKSFPAARSPEWRLPPPDGPWTGAGAVRSRPGDLLGWSARLRRRGVAALCSVHAPTALDLGPSLRGADRYPLATTR